MAIVLNTPNQSFQNDADLIDTEAIVLASASNNAFTNTGVLWATPDTRNAIDFTDASSNGTITNSSTGYIRGGFSAVSFQGNGATINNAGEMMGGQFGVFVEASGPAAVTLNNVFGGTIKSGQTAIYFNPGSGSEINNDGIVYGGNTGVELENGSGLTNSGEVGGSSYAIECDGDTTVVNTNFGGIWSTGTAIVVAGGKATITNNADCLITGSQAAIVTEDTLTDPGRISLTNLGKIDGQIDCNATIGNVNDTIVNTGTINGDVFLGTGADLFYGTGGTSGKIFGEDGSDTLTGSSANDQLYGGSGNDLISGGRGKDTLSGGSEADIFDFNSVKESLKGARRDTIGDFERGLDKIDLFDIDAKTGRGNQKFKFIGKQDFHDVKGELRYKDLGSKVIVQGDVNGDGKADFEIFVAVGALAKGDFLL